MNYRFIARQLGLLMFVMSGLLLVLVTWSGSNWRFADGGDIALHAFQACLASALVGALLGSGLLLASRGAETRLGRREAMLLVAATWIVGAAVAALPFHGWALLHTEPGDPQPFRNYVDCYFEAMSGLTTTGATVLSDIEALPPTLMLWRSLTHWLGGLGIVVLFVAVLPSLGTGGKRLFRVEAPGPRHEGVKPHIAETARLLWIIYLGMTIACLLSYRATGAMGWFDAMCHAFSTVSTGGLSTRDASIAYFGSPAVEVVAIVFMLLAGVNFALFFQISQGRWRTVWRDVELRVYLITKVLVIIAIIPALIGTTTVLTTGDVEEGTVGFAIRNASFVTVALHTGTGFCTADYDRWPFFTQAMLVGLMFVGGCAGSTAGGVKVVRFWVTIKVMAAQLEKAFRPDVVRPLKIGGSTVDPEMKLAAVAYVLGFGVVFIAGAVAIKLFQPGPDCDFATAMTASLSTLANVGPGLRHVGPTQNYGWFGDGAKIVMALLMVLGRLEFFAIVVLLTPRYWRGR